jgi:four helix bundle protein
MVPPDNDLRQRTKSFALRVIRMFATLPKTAEAQVLGKQVLRSGTSIGANYRERHIEAEVRLSLSRSAAIL